MTILGGYGPLLISTHLPHLPCLNNKFTQQFPIIPFTIQSWLQLVVLILIICVCLFVVNRNHFFAVDAINFNFSPTFVSKKPQQLERQVNAQKQMKRENSNNTHTNIQYCDVGISKWSHGIVLTTGLVLNFTMCTQHLYCCKYKINGNRYQTLVNSKI